MIIISDNITNWNKPKRLREQEFQRSVINESGRIINNPPKDYGEFVIYSRKKSNFFDPKQKDLDNWF